MGTKNNPGRFDCYDRAEPDEPHFTLLARDPVAADMVKVWACLRVGALDAAYDAFDGLMNKLDLRRPRLIDSADPVALSEAITTTTAQRLDVEKAAEAIKCSESMAEWIKANRPERVL